MTLREQAEASGAPVNAMDALALILLCGIIIRLWKTYGGKSK